MINFVIIGDFNVGTSNILMRKFCETYNLKNLIKNPTCFKNIDNPSCIALILANHYKCLQDSNFFETRFSDIHNLTYLALKSYFLKQGPGIIKYRDYAKFSNNKFRAELVKVLSFKSSHVNQFK